MDGGYIEKWMDRWMNGWMADGCDGWMDNVEDGQ